MRHESLFYGGCSVEVVQYHLRISFIPGHLSPPPLFSFPKLQVIVVWVGTNNHENTAEEVAGGIEAIVQLINTRQPQAKIIVLVCNLGWVETLMPLGQLRNLLEIGSFISIKNLQVEAVYVTPETRLSDISHCLTGLISQTSCGVIFYLLMLV